MKYTTTTSANNKTLSPLSEDFILNRVYVPGRSILSGSAPAVFQSSKSIRCVITMPD